MSSRNKLSPFAFFSRLRGLGALGRLGRTLRLRLWMFFAFVVLTMAAIVSAVLFLTGTLSLRNSGGRLVFDNELRHLAVSTERRMGHLSAMAIRMGRHLSRSIEHFLEERELTTDDLRRHPELLRPLLANQFDNLMLSLEQAKTTGAFLILDATASRRMREARTSRAGLYLVDWEPELVSGSMLQFQLLRGPSQIALERGLVMEKYWAMEFDIEDADYFAHPQRCAMEHPESAHRVGFWYPTTTIRGTARKAMLCSVPLIDSRGGVFGVCGFDVSDLQFKRTTMPAANIYGGIFCTLAPATKSGLDVSSALVSWRYFAEEEPGGANRLSPAGGRDGFTLYRTDGGESLIGGARPMRIQPSGLSCSAPEFTFALLVPEREYDAVRSARNGRFVLILAVISLAGILVSFFFSRWYVRPILRAIAAVKEGADEPPVTRIAEIDDLIEFLTARASVGRAEPSEGMGPDTGPTDDEVEREFNERVRTLSRAEHNVFDLYVRGCSAAEIAATLGISPNTVKTHNRNIFAKMQVSSQRELLMTYIDILKKRRDR